MQQYLWCFLFLFACSTGADQRAAQKRTLDISEEVTIAEIRADLEAGKYTIEALTKYYLDRIAVIDDAGPTLNAVLTINPDAMEIARQLDAEWEAGADRGPMHGIPVLLKDNINTGDQMPTTAGARLMAESYPAIDSPLAAQLRKAGAVILGKANLSEWANFHSSSSSSGWSGLGGQTKNPYDLTRNPCGSSAGSGAAVAANLCVVAIGTETNGSIVCPSNNNGIVGIKPTVGLISRTGIVPISFTQDTGGPMARTVTDAVKCLGVLTAEDSLDAKTLIAGRVALADYTRFLNPNGIKGKRIGYYKSPLGDRVKMTAIMEEAVAFLETNGATIVEVDNIMPRSTNGSSYQVLLYEFKDGINQYLAALGDRAKAKDLAEIIEKTLADSVEMRYHDHATLQLAQSKGDLNSEAYQEALATILKNSRAEGIDKVMDENRLDAIIAPTGGPAWKTDLINGDNFGGIFSSSPAAIAGYPSITVPMGNVEGMPVGISFFGRAWSEPILIEMAYAYEQGTQKRITPLYLGYQE